MRDRQPTPQRDARGGQPMQQVPTAKLQLVFTLDGVTAEPLLTYQHKPTTAPASLRRFFAARDVPAQKMASPEQRHTARARAAARDTAWQVPQHLAAVARQAHHNREDRPEHTPAKDHTHERH